MVEVARAYRQLIFSKVSLPGPSNVVGRPEICLGVADKSS
jgi:hypothetical protein